MRRIVILGSTGSIGRQTLDIVRTFRHEFEVVGLAAGNNTALLLEQVAEFSPRYIWCTTPPSPLPEGTTLLPMDEMAALPEVDQVMVALMGAVGLSPTMNALRAGKQVALSNKEPIVMAGQTLKETEAKHGGVILPVDSEPQRHLAMPPGRRQPHSPADDHRQRRAVPPHSFGRAGEGYAGTGPATPHLAHGRQDYH